MVSAVQESGWAMPHVFGTNRLSQGKPLNNLFGMTDAGGNNLPYPDLDASAAAWEQQQAPHVQRQAELPGRVGGALQATGGCRRRMRRERDAEVNISMMLGVLMAVVLPVAGTGRGATPRPPAVRSCNAETAVRRGVGTAYRGTVRNDDYRFVADVPAGMTGWSGVASGAPFHGFTIFLESSPQSCIVFDIHLRVDEEDGPRMPAGVPMFGGATGEERVARGTARGVRLRTVVTTFSRRRAHETDDGSVTLITPEDDVRRTEPVYREFLQKLRFLPE